MRPGVAPQAAPGWEERSREPRVKAGESLLEKSRRLFLPMLNPREGAGSEFALAPAQFDSPAGRKIGIVWSGA